MATLTGSVEAKKRDGKAIKVGGEWYGARNSSYFANVNRGDTIQLEYSVNGTWKNCDENSPVVVTAGAPAAASSGGGYKAGGKVGGRVSGFRDPDEIIRQESVAQAVAFHANNPEFNDPSKYKDTATKVLRTAELISKYVKGDIDVTRSAPARDVPQVAAPVAPAPAPAPVAPAPAPAAPEPAEQEARVGSALSEFFAD